MSQTDEMERKKRFRRFISLEVLNLYASCSSIGGIKKIKIGDLHFFILCIVFYQIFHNAIKKDKNPDDFERNPLSRSVDQTPTGILKCHTNFIYLLRKSAKSVKINRGEILQTFAVAETKNRLNLICKNNESEVISKLTKSFKLALDKFNRAIRIYKERKQL
ncbi:hypothetical protein BpHYR1_000099 [Brachionus plicatilis]|uniref:Uncharacterized protein n=1 Tax=Brachionus plicatilis TaxID=10195 RepID=A0A3M7RMX7_BRAPC|nr:hypothetical protein BpHYR1_000099 [Brachionus plicatilis]